MIKTLKLDTSKLMNGVLLAVIVVMVVFTQEKLRNDSKTIETLKAQNTEMVKVGDTLLQKNESLNAKITEVKKTSLVQFTETDLMKDIIQQYPNISTRVKKEIVKTVLDESIKYNINPLIVYSLIHTESSMRPWIEHKQTTIVINKKKLRIKAVGLGGVVWEWWGNGLKENNIADVRSDLFDPAINIRSTVFVYNELFKRAKHPKAKNQDESAMIRYFGGGYVSYFQKIDKKIASLIKTKMYRDKYDKPVISVEVSTIIKKEIIKGKL